MDQNERGLEAALENWRKGAASIEGVRALARNLGVYLYMPGIPALIQLLDHNDEMVRYNAVASLASNFIHIPATGRLLTMLTSDSDEDCRSMAASGLANLCHDTRERAGARGPCKVCA